VERVAVAVEGRQGQAAGAELAEVVLPGLLARAEVVDGQVDGRKPPELISTLVSPRLLIMSRASPRGLSPRQAL
jgi:hypothetical protein